MKSWNRSSDEIKFENDEKVIEYKLEFYTTNKKEILYLEKIFQKLMDNDVDEILKIGNIEIPEEFEYDEGECMPQEKKVDKHDLDMSWWDDECDTALGEEK